MWIFNLVPFTLNTIFWVNNYEECVGKAMFLRYRHQTWIENNNHFWKISYAEGTGTGAGASLPGRAALRPDVLASPSRWAAVSLPCRRNTRPQGGPAAGGAGVQVRTTRGASPRTAPHRRLRGGPKRRGPRQPGVESDYRGFSW